jgi:hypothetical protein
MSEDYEKLLEFFELDERNRAKNCAAWLADYLKRSPFPVPPSFLSDFHDNLATYEQLFTAAISLCKALEGFRRDVCLARYFGAASDDPLLLANSASMLHLLLLAAEEYSVPPCTLTAVEEGYHSCLDAFLSAVMPQIDALCQFLLEVNRLLRRMSLSNSRIILVDLPVGNTIPVLLLFDLLNGSAKVDIVRASLARNDSQRQGLTRKELLIEKIHEAQISVNDIVIYMDEWNTGSNFNAICEVLRTELPHGSFLLPLALLTSTAPSAARWDSFRDDHDKLLKPWGSAFAEGRKMLPPIETSLPLKTPFFWSENDRFGGFRKMQVHGSIFSSFDETIEMLRADKEALKFAITIQLAIIAKSDTPPCGIGPSVGTLEELFDEGYEDYLKCREQLRQCGQDYAHGGETDDLTKELAAVCEIQNGLLKDRPARWAYLLAETYMRKLGSIDPADRYYFKNHAPILVPLQGRMALPHKLTMEFLRRRMAEYDKGDDS